MLSRLKLYRYTRTSKDGSELPYWTARYLFDGKAKAKDIPINIQDKKQAEAWITDQLTGSKTVPAKTIKIYADDWISLKRKEQISEATIKQFRSNMDVWILPHMISGLDLETQLTILELRDFVKSIARAPYTVRNVLQTLRTFIDDARTEGWIKLEHNPATEKPVAKAVPKKDDANNIITISKNDAVTLLNVSTYGVNEVKWLLALSTGMRDSEMQALTFADVDLSAGLINVNKQLERYVNRGNTREFTIKKPKRNSQRFLPTTDRLLQVLTTWKKVGWKSYVGRTPEPTDPILPSRFGKHVLNRSAVLLRQALTAKKLPTEVEGKPITAHALRRTFATVLVDAGAEEAKVSRLLGHAGKSVADQHYIKRNVQTYQPVIQLLPWAHI